MTGDIICGNCGEPYESYYVYNDMTLGERARFQTGKWCPSCKGALEWICRKYPAYYVDDRCEHFKEFRCTAPEDHVCEHRHNRKDGLKRYLISATENTDEDPLELIHRALGP